MRVTEFECYTSRLPECQQCSRRTRIIFFGTVQPSTCIFIIQGFNHPVKCFNQNIVRVQQNYNIKIAILIHNVTGNMGQATQTFEEKEKIRRKKYVSKLYPNVYLWSHGNKVVYSHTSNTFKNMREGNQE